MKNTIKTFLFAAVSMLIITSCQESDDMRPQGTQNTNDMVGNFEVLRGGTLTAQSSTNTNGMIQIVKSDNGDHFVRLSDDFTTKFSTGTVTVYLSNSSSLNLNQSSSFQVVSLVNEAGEHFFKLSAEPDEKFTYGIIWCGAAGIPFGYSNLQ